MDDVSYNVEYTDSADLYQGDYKVTSPVNTAPPT